MIKTFVSNFTFSKVKYFLNVRSLYDALMQSSLMLSLKVRFLSIFIPSNATSFNFLILALLIWVSKDLASLISKSHKLKFARSSFYWSNFKPFQHPDGISFQVWNNILNVFSSTIYCISSAKIQISDFLINKNKSFVNMLKSRDPSKDLCGTPLMISCQEL